MNVYTVSYGRYYRDFPGARASKLLTFLSHSHPVHLRECTRAENAAASRRRSEIYELQKGSIYCRIYYQSEQTVQPCAPQPSQLLSFIGIPESHLQRIGFSLGFSCVWKYKAQTVNLQWKSPFEFYYGDITVGRKSLKLDPFQFVVRK